MKITIEDDEGKKIIIDAYGTVVLQITDERCYGKLVKRCLNIIADTTEATEIPRLKDLYIGNTVTYD